MKSLPVIFQKLWPMLKLDTNTQTNTQTHKQTHKQTGQKQYAPHFSGRGHKKYHRIYGVDTFCFCSVYKWRQQQKDVSLTYNLMCYFLFYIIALFISIKEEILDEVHLSKKAFKKAIGVLYKKKKIKLEKDRIILL